MSGCIGLILCHMSVFHLIPKLIKHTDMTQIIMMTSVHTVFHGLDTAATKRGIIQERLSKGTGGVTVPHNSPLCILG